MWSNVTSIKFKGASHKFFQFKHIIMLSDMTIKNFLEVQTDSLAKYVIKSTRQIILKLYYEVCGVL